jgi:hypothetical protein
MQAQVDRSHRYRGIRPNMSVKRALCLLGVLALASTAGCASGGGATTATDGGSSPQTTSISTSQNTLSGGLSQITVSGDGTFNGVACTSAENCWATANNDQIFHGVQGTWTPVQSPTASSLYGIACPSATDCWAVGAVVPPGSGSLAQAQIEHFDGTSWSVFPAPTISAYPESGLNAVTCSSTSDCWASGISDDPSSNTAGAPVVLQFNGTMWSLASQPIVGQGPNTQLLSCPSQSQCFLFQAVSVTNSDGSESPVQQVAVLSNGTWNMAAAPPSGVLFQGASCPQDNDCYAVGGPDINGSNQTLYHFDGTNWTQVAPVSTGSDSALSIYALDCPVDGICWAGGGQPINGGNTPAVVIHYADGTWSTPAQPTVFGQYVALTCLSSSACWAVGAKAPTASSSGSVPLAVRTSS